MLLQELKRSSEPKPVDLPSVDLFAGSFPEQMAFVEDESDLQFAFCTRRAAKSYSGGLKAYRKALQIPRCSVLIAGLHRDEVKRIWWEPIIKDIAERHGISHKANETELSIRLGNGSFIYLLGMDADERQKRKALGQKFALVLIDEAQDWLTDLHALVFSVLKPAVADYNGTICMLGTPGLVAKGLFYDVTTGKEPGWKRHEWDTYHNTTRQRPGEPTMAEKWDREIKKLIAMKPGVEKTPWFLRNYKKQWVVDEDAKVYRYQAGRNDFETLPHYRLGSWHYVLGCDLGFTDESALVVVAYHDHDRVLYALESQAESGLDVTDVANRAKALARKYSFEAWVVDGANKQAVEEMKRRHELPWEAADKTGKADFIELMNAEFLTAGIKLRPSACQTLTDPKEGDYASLIWEQKLLRDTGKREEDPRCKNHSADAMLYAWRHCYQYLSEREPDAAPKVNTPEWHEAQAKRTQDEVEQAYEEQLEAMTSMRREQEEAEDEMGWL